MSPDKIQAALLAFTGWSLPGDPRHSALTSSFYFPDQFVVTPTGVLVFRQRTPDFLNDLNALHEAHELLTSDQHRKFRTWLQTIAYERPAVPGNRHRSTSNATCAQFAEAILRTVGKWEDGK